MVKNKKVNRMKDLMDPSQLENKYAAVKIIYKDLDHIDVKFEGQYADVIGLGADIYSALVEEIIDRSLLNAMIINGFESLRKYEKMLIKDAFIDFRIDNTSNIKAKINGNSIVLAISYMKFLNKVTEHYNISLLEYYNFIQDSYDSWRKSDKKRVFLDNIKRG